MKRIATITLVSALLQHSMGDLFERNKVWNPNHKANSGVDLYFNFEYNKGVLMSPAQPVTVSESLGGSCLNSKRVYKAS